MKIIGRINPNIIQQYKSRMKTNEVILTKERKLHIYNNHRKDFKEIMNNIKQTIVNPNEIIEDIQNTDTLMFIRKLVNNNLNVIIKLNTTNDIKHQKNSIMTAWIIRNKNLKKLEKKNKIIYKK